MKLGDLKTATLDDNQVKALVKEWLAGDDPKFIPWGQGSMNLTTVHDNYFQPWMVAKNKKPDNNALAKTLLVYRFGHALEIYPEMVTKDANGNVSFHLSHTYMEKWITEGDNVPWNMGAYSADEIASSFFEWFDKVNPKESNFILSAYNEPAKIAYYIGRSIQKSQHETIGKNRRRSYTVEPKTVSNKQVWEFYSSHNADLEGRTLVQHWLYSRRDEDVPWADEIGPSQLKDTFDAFCTRYFREEYSVTYDPIFISRESLMECLQDYAHAPKSEDTFKVVRYKNDKAEQKYRFYHPTRAELRDKYDLANPQPLGFRMFRAIMANLSDRPTDLWTLFSNIEEQAGVPIPFHEVQYARLKLLDGGFLSNDRLVDGVPLWSVAKPYGMPKAAPVVAPVVASVVVPAVVETKVPDTRTIDLSYRKVADRWTIMNTLLQYPKGLSDVVLADLVTDKMHVATMRSTRGVMLGEGFVSKSGDVWTAIGTLEDFQAAVERSEVKRALVTAPLKVPPVSTAPKAPPPIPADTHRILSISEIVRLFTVGRHHVQRVIDKYELKQHTKTRYHVPIALIEEMQAKVKRTLIPANPIGAKYDAARRTIAADIARAFNKLGVIPSYNDYLAWDDRSLEFANKDAFNHYFSDWDAALIVAGVLKPPVKPTLVKPVKAERPTISIAVPPKEATRDPLLRSVLWEDLELMELQQKPKTLTELKQENPTIDPSLVTRMHELAELGRQSRPVEPEDAVLIEEEETETVVEDAVEAPVEAPEVASEVDEDPDPPLEEADFYEDYDFFRSAIVWTPIDPITKKLNYEVLRNLTGEGWYPNTVIRVSDIAGCNPMALGQIFGVVLSLPQHQFLFETRDVKFFNDLNEQISWEPHMYVGFKTHILYDNDDFVQSQLNLLGQSQARIRFINSDLIAQSLASLDLSNVDWVIAGVPQEQQKDTADLLVRTKNACFRQGKAFYFKGWYGGIGLSGWLYRFFPKLTPEQINSQTAELLRLKRGAFRAANTWASDNKIAKNLGTAIPPKMYDDYKDFVVERSYEKGNREAFSHVFERFEWDMYIRFIRQQELKKQDA